MIFSIILASRGRPQLLHNFLESLQKNSRLSYEVIIGIDNDDHDTYEESKKWGDNIRFFRRDRAPNINNDYLNWLAPLAQGKYLLACNDDVEFPSPGWDETASNTIEEYLKDKPDRIAYGAINRELTFPVITREAMRSLGFLMPPEFPGWNADIACWRIFSCVDRVVTIPNVSLLHISHHNGRRERDDVNRNMEAISSGAPSGHQYDVSPHVEKLINATHTKIPEDYHVSLYIPVTNSELLGRLMDSMANTAYAPHVVHPFIFGNEDIGGLPVIKDKFNHPTDCYNHLPPQNFLTIYMRENSIFQTRYWDRYMFLKIRNFVKEKGNVVYGKINDGSPQASMHHADFFRHYAVYSHTPLVSQAAIELHPLPTRDDYTLAVKDLFNFHADNGTLLDLSAIIIDSQH